MKKSDRGALRDALLAMSLGWDLVLPICIGVLVGSLLDRRLGTGYGFAFGLTLFGIVTGFYNVARAIRRMEACEQRDALQVDDGGEVE